MLKSTIIKERKKMCGLTIADICEAVGVTHPTVCRWLSGDTQKISEEKLNKLAKVLNTTADHLCGLDHKSRLKPILGIVKAGYHLFAEENILGYEEVTEKEATQGDYYLRVVGDSMINARIYEGDLLYVRACSDVDSGQIAVVLINDNEATVKRVIKKEHMMILEASNPAYENRYFTEQEIEELPVRILGRVIHNKVSFK